MLNDQKIRCPWATHHKEDCAYHDSEWGVPKYDDQTLFEFITLEAAQAGLSWRTILLKRAGYKKCFADFKPELVAKFTAEDVERLMLDTSIIRNRRKIEYAISNARIFLELQAKYGSFSNYIWGFVDGKPIKNAWQKPEDVPATSTISDKMAKEFKKLGFGFLGSTVLYAHMQATGLVNDHIVSCFRYDEC